jgi:ArsR family transcriptional regulator, zinc-responsive transcriptional repressor
VHICIGVVASAPSSQSRRKAARELAEILDSTLFRALCEPVRVEILKLLTVEGRADVGTIAARVPQDRSVVSRHLALLHHAGVLRREKVGRRVFFQIDGARIVDRMERLLERFRRIVPMCCPTTDERSLP